MCGAGQYLADLAEQYPVLRHACLLPPAASNRRPVSPDPVDAEIVWAANDRAIESFLVVAQKIAASESMIRPENGSLISLATQDMKCMSDALFTKSALSKAEDCCNACQVLPTSQAELASAALRRLAPFIRDYAFVLARSTQLLTRASRSAYKLAYVLNSVVLNIAREGFCQPSEAGDQQKQGGDGQTEAGTGLGAGTGQEDVSKEIEDESQVEGLQGEKDEESGGQEQAEDDAIEMDQDVGGDLEDAKSNEGSEAGSGDEEDGDNELDDELNDLEGEGVNEKFWDGDQEGQEEKADDDQVQKQAGPSEDSEMAAKENKANGAKPEPQPESADSDQPDNAPEAEAPAQPEQDADSEGNQQPEKGAEEVQIPEQEILDLPDDLIFDDEASRGEEDDDAAMDDPSMDPDLASQEDDTGSGDDQDSKGDPDQDVEDGEMETEQPATADESGEDNLQDDPDFQHQMDVSAGADVNQDGDAQGESVGDEARADGQEGPADDSAAAPDEAEKQFTDNGTMEGDVE